MKLQTTFRNRIDAKSVSLKISLFCLGCLVALGACTRDDDEAMILKQLAALEKSIQEKRSGDIPDYLWKDFSDQDGRSVREYRRLAVGYFLRYKKVYLAKQKVDVKVEGDNARMEVIASFAGGKDWKPQRAESYAAQIDWQKRAGEWRMYRMIWHRLAFIGE